MKHHFRISDTDLLRSCQMYFDPSILPFSTRLKQIEMRRHVNGRLREILFKSGGFPWLTFTYIIREQNRCKPQMLLAARAYREGKGLSLSCRLLSFTVRASRMLDRNVKDAMLVIRSLNRS